MKTLVPAVISLAMMAAVVSCRYPEPLPSRVLSKLEKGKRLDEVWISPQFNPQLGYSIEIKWLDKNINLEYLEYVKKEAQKLELQNSPNRLFLYCSIGSDLIVLHPLSDAGFRIEGIIKDSNGNEIAAFVNNRSVLISSKSNMQAAISDSFKYINEELNPK